MIPEGRKPAGTTAFGTVFLRSFTVLGTIAGAFALISFLARLLAVDLSRPHLLVLKGYREVTAPIAEMIRTVLAPFSLTNPQFDLLVLYALLVGMAYREETTKKFHSDAPLTAAEARAALGRKFFVDGSGGRGLRAFKFLTYEAANLTKFLCMLVIFDVVMRALALIHDGSVNGYAVGIGALALSGVEATFGKAFGLPAGNVANIYILLALNMAVLICIDLTYFLLHQNRIHWTKVLLLTDLYDLTPLARLFFHWTRLRPLIKSFEAKSGGSIQDAKFDHIDTVQDIRADLAATRLSFAYFVCIPAAAILFFLTNGI